jgi:hypothetical protein
MRTLRPPSEDNPPPEPKLASLFLHELTEEGGVAALYCILEDAHLNEAANVVARGIAKRRIGVNQRLHEVWLEQLALEDRPELPGSDRQLLAASLLQNIGTPTKPAAVEHLYGLVAEELWLQLITEEDMGLGLPIRVEGHDWSATDPGGDGLTVYALQDDDFCFRLWESKYHGTGDPIRQTVGIACRQVKARVLSYLARFSLIASRLTDNPPLAVFYGRLPEMWVDKDAAAGVSIVVGASNRDDAACFEAIPDYFGLGPEHHQGQLNTVGDFVGLAARVREVLWAGCGL